MRILGTKTKKEFRDQYMTPDLVSNWAIRKYGCDVDLAARVENKKCPYYYSDKVDPMDADCLGDGLLEAWRTPARPERMAGWLNMPYSNIGPWLCKAVNEAINGFTTVSIMPTLNGEKWNRWAMFAREIIFIEGRIPFVRPDTGLPASGNTRGSMLCIFGPHNQTSPSMSYLRLKEMT